MEKKERSKFRAAEMMETKEEVSAFEEEFGTEDKCLKNPKGHEPNWSLVTLESDGGELYLDVNCKHCGRSGCVGTVQKLEENISW